MTASNFLIGDMAYVATEKFVGWARVSGVQNKGHEVYYYLQAGPDNARIILYCNVDEIFGGIPVNIEGSNPDPHYFFGRASNERN